MWKKFYHLTTPLSSPLLPPALPCWLLAASPVWCSTGNRSTGEKKRVSILDNRTIRTAHAHNFINSCVTASLLLQEIVQMRSLLQGAAEGLGVSLCGALC